jgi:hypothetical protein
MKKKNNDSPGIIYVCIISLLGVTILHQIYSMLTLCTGGKIYIQFLKSIPDVEHCISAVLNLQLCRILLTAIKMISILKRAGGRVLQ